MAKDHRRIDNTGKSINYSCSNNYYRTNIAKGFTHGNSRTRGSVFKEPLVKHSDYTLWLEHVEEIKSGQEMYWLMWYNSGVPTIPLSGIFDKDELKRLTQLLNSGDAL